MRTACDGKHRLAPRGRAHAHARVRMCECVSGRCLRAKMRAETYKHVRTFTAIWHFVCLSSYDAIGTVIAEATTMEARRSSHALMLWGVTQ